MESDVATRPHYRLRQDPAVPGVCVREARTPHGAEMLPAHVAGWELTHDLLAPCAPAFAEYDGTRIRTELIPGRALHEHYGAARRGETMPPLPWHDWWVALTRMYDSGRQAPPNPKLIPSMSWATWFSITRLAEAKRESLTGAWQRPDWSLMAWRALLVGRISGGYTLPPLVVDQIASRSTVGLTTGDMHLANIVGTTGRMAFVDFSEVAVGPVALDLTPLWFEWWLAQGLVAGDDGFLEGFRGMWTRYVGEEALLTRMTAEFCARWFPWMVFAFYAHHLGLDRARAMTLTGRVWERVEQLQTQLAKDCTFADLIAEAS